MQRNSRRVGLAMTTALTLTAALTVITASAASADHGPDLSSTSAIESYLVSIGVDPAEAVWQEGLRNYAGPDCPGLGWNCVPADAPIVQIAAPLGINLFSCTELDCVGVQIALGAGQNEGVCDPGERHDDDAVQVCFIGQVNDDGNNVAVINQSIQQKGAVVTARQVARIEQVNMTGRNVAGFHQVITQSSNVRGTVQSQEAHQAATLDQETTTGDNSSNIDQRQDQVQRASGSDSIIQKQNTEEGVDFFCDGSALGTPSSDQEKNQCAEVFQDSNLTPPDGGSNRSNLDQNVTERQTASNAMSVDQDQGTASGRHGQAGTVVQNSSAPVINEARQETIQRQTATAISGGVNPGDQFKDTGDPRCCATQTDNEDSSSDITQMTDQAASSDGAVQVARFEGTCLSSGSCHVFQSATIDGSTDTNECPDPDDPEAPDNFCSEIHFCMEQPVGENGGTETQCQPSD